MLPDPKGLYLEYSSDGFWVLDLPVRPLFWKATLADLEGAEGKPVSELGGGPLHWQVSRAFGRRE